MANQYADQVFKALAQDPQKMNELLQGNDKQAVRSILNNTEINDAELDAVTKEIEENAVVRLYQGAGGAIDAKQLMDMTGGFTPDRSAPSKGKGVAALLDGKLDINDILALASLMGAGSQPAQQQTASPASGLLSAFLGGGQSQPVQNNTPQANSMNSLLSAMFGVPQQQPVQQAPQQTNNSLFSALFPQPVQQQPVQQPQAQAVDINTLLSQLMGAQQTQVQQPVQQPQVQQSQQVGLSSLLGSLMGGGSASSGGQMFTESTTAPKPPVTSSSQTFNNVLNGSASATNANGTVDLNSLFGVLNDLMGKK